MVFEPPRPFSQTSNAFSATPQTIEEARDFMKNRRCWIITDGKMGDLAPCLGLAERLGLNFDEKIIHPRAPWCWLMPKTWRLPWLNIDPKEAPGAPSSPFQPPYPDLIIAAGRRAAPYLSVIQRAKAAAGPGRCFTVFLRDPRASAALADFIWVPQHDRLRGENVMATLLSPHRISPEKLKKAREETPAFLTQISSPDFASSPKLAVLIGGNSRAFQFTEQNIKEFSVLLEQLVQAGFKPLATSSRRTPPAFAAAARQKIEAAGGWFWDGSGANPYLALLACADAVLVSAESINMVGEAAAIGKPIFLFHPTGKSRKHSFFIDELKKTGAIINFNNSLPDMNILPQDDSDKIALTLTQRYFNAIMRE